jgi:transcriptional regulator with XRE-family HTH domain
MTGHEYLKQKRREHGLSLRALDELTGVSYGYIREIEEGKKQPTFDVLWRLLTALGVPFGDFLKVVGYKAPRRGKVVAVQGFEPRHVGHKNKHLAAA